MSENGHIDTFKITVFASTGEHEIEAVAVMQLNGFVLLIDTKTGKQYWVHRQRLAKFYERRKKQQKIQRAIRRPAA